MNVAFIIAFIGDYHAPRLLKLQEQLAAHNSTLFIYQSKDHSDFYTHQQSRRHKLLSNLNVLTPSAGSRFTTFISIQRFLGECSAEAVVVLGYTDVLSLSALAYATTRKCPIYFLSDSKADDQPRSRIGEMLKGLLVRCFSGAMVAGDRHGQYFRSLGFNGPIQTGYDVIDNDYFSSRADKYRKRAGCVFAEGLLPEKYFLCVSRLVKRKRVDSVLRIYNRSGVADLGFRLMIIGSGPEAENIAMLIVELELSDSVCIVPMVDNSRMPLFYSRATALILASEYDQWGLCINEAMACGVPALVSERCGAANEIVIDGENGVVFKNGDLAKPASEMMYLARDPQYAIRLGLAAKKKMREWDLAKFSDGITRLVQGGV